MLQSARLDRDLHDLQRFDSGESDLDDWLKAHAADSDAKRMTRTFLWCLEGGHEVVGYYSLMSHKVVREELPAKLARGNPSEVPAVLLARLALAKSAQGGGLGGELLVDAMRRVVAATEQVAARLVVVDAIHERAANFYEHYGFSRIPDSRRLFRKVSAIERDVR